MFATSRYIASSLLFKQVCRKSFPKSFRLFFLFVLEVLVATEGFSLSITQVSAAELGDSTSMSSLLLSDCESVDSVLMSSGSSRAIWMSLTSTVLLEFSGWMNKVFIPLRIVKVAGTVGELFVCLKRTRSHRSKSVTAGSLTLRPSSSSTGVFPRVLEVYRCVIKARCRKAPNDTLRFGLQAWIARFTVWTARSAIPFALGW